MGLTPGEVRLRAASSHQLVVGYPRAMSHWRLSLAGLIVALMFEPADASAVLRPSDRACPLAWNAHRCVA